MQVSKTQWGKLTAGFLLSSLEIQLNTTQLWIVSGVLPPVKRMEDALTVLKSTVAEAV